MLSVRTALHNDELAPVEIVVRLTHDRSILRRVHRGEYIVDDRGVSERVEIKSQQLILSLYEAEDNLFPTCHRRSSRRQFRRDNVNWIASHLPRSTRNKTYALNHTKAPHIPSDISSFGARILRETKKAGRSIGDRWKYSWGFTIISAGAPRGTTRLCARRKMALHISNAGNSPRVNRASDRKRRSHPTLSSFFLSQAAKLSRLGESESPRGWSTDDARASISNERRAYHSDRILRPPRVSQRAFLCEPRYWGCCFKYSTRVEISPTCRV